jgi:peroxiredoxin
LAAKPLLLRARRGEMATVRETVAMDGDRVTLRLERDALVTLSGHVTDTTGRPIAGAKASLAEWLYESGQGCGEAITDAQGRYAFAALWPNSRYSVRASAKGYGQAWSHQLDDLRPGQKREVPPLALKKADQSVAGRVVDAHGAPVAGATVYISGRDTAQQGQTTDQEGRFRFDDVVAETVELQCNVGRPGQFGSRKVPAGTLDAVLVLPGETEPPRPLAIDELAKRFATLDGQRAPALHTVAWVNSPPRTLSQLKGKVVLINFWGVGCGPCMAELPAVQRTAERFADRDVVVVGLHDSSGSASQLQALAKRNQLTYPMAVDAPDDPKVSGGKTFRAYGVQAIPSVAVIDREGKVAYLGMSLAEAVGTLGRLVGR